MSAKLQSPRVSRMPMGDMRPVNTPFGLDVLISELSAFDEGEALKAYPWAKRFVMGMPLAPWQRDFKWSQDQCQRFIRSIWTGVNLGSYVVTQAELKAEGNGFKGVEYLKHANMVIDGQQRLGAIERFVTDRLAVADAQGQLTLWSDPHSPPPRKPGQLTAGIAGKFEFVPATVNLFKGMYV